MEIKPKIDIAVISLIVVTFIAVMKIGLLPALIAGMITFLMMRLAENFMSSYLKLGNKSRFIATLFTSLLIIGVLTLLSMYSISWLYKTVSNPETIVNETTIVLDKTIKDLPPNIANFFPQDIQKLKQSLVEFTHENVALLRDFSRGATHTLITMILGMIIGIMIAASDFQETKKPLLQSIREKSNNLVQSFSHVMVAQAGIAAFNAIMTSIFLFAVMPIFNVDFPFAKTIVILTFVIGLIPIIGNLIVNVMVLIIGLSVSTPVGISSLLYLMFIHKFEYFLNAKIIGARIEAKAFELLIAMLFMESIFGLIGLVAAPVLYCYIKNELKEFNLI